MWSHSKTLFNLKSISGSRRPILELQENNSWWPTAERIPSFFKSVTESLDLESHFKNHNKNQKSVGSA
jgi:hypothetical protein